MHGIGEVENILVTRENVKVTIDKLFDEGEEVEERRNWAKKLSELTKHAVQEEGPSYKNIKLLIEDALQEALKGPEFQSHDLL